MIHHVSIPARDPRHVAEILAEVMGGHCYPFGPLIGTLEGRAKELRRRKINPDESVRLIRDLPARIDDAYGPR